MSTPEPPINSCDSLLNPSITNFGFSIFITLGILLSYLPQHHRIISRKSSEGISPFFVLLGVTSGTCTFVNILLLSRTVLGCCSEIGGLNCFAASLGVGQVGLQWACFAVILVLYILYFPTPIPSEHPHTISSTHPTFRTAVIVAIASAAHFAIIAALSLYYLAEKTPKEVVAFANSLGVQATILASLQYFPQIWTTWKLKHVGSLSIPMMFIQTPGSFVWAVSLAAREGTKWSSWLVYVVTGTLQGILLAMCLAWEWRARQAKLDAVGEVNGNGAIGGRGVDGDFAEEEDNVNERTGLVGNERR
ncbi:hypothetical protein BJ508DRAFT_417295 [Ascobolus immersus RN42]|uniref:PQ loop repeat protein n=1 Tax=Ascobolus immersus RN42 TaxID=1160509 RepID=A0A3N4HT98_ASCIM|nr:hypothetical protein BJ508DRAFT_417295 [Ascobolus immersus RN42]